MGHVRAHNRQVLALVGQIHKRHALAEVYPQCLLFMVDCLRLVEPSLPAVARGALVVAEKYCNGTASAAQLAAQQTLCWNDLQARGESHTFERQRTRLMRATLCALYPSPPPDGDVYVLLEWFVDMLDPEGRLESRTLELLELRFDAVAG